MNKSAEIVEIIIRSTGMGLIIYGAIGSVKLLLGKVNKLFDKPVIQPETVDSALSHYTDWTYPGIVGPYTIEAISFLLVGVVILFLSTWIANIICRDEHHS